MKIVKIISFKVNRETNKIEKLREWKKEMLECSNVIDCKIIKIEDIEL